jgi:hypothetical protein
MVYYQLWVLVLAISAIYNAVYVTGTITPMSFILSALAALGRY